MIELLAPAGSHEALVAAIESGADAVYLGGRAFGARSYAPNFTDEELAESIRFAHLYGVRIFVTVNTIVDSAEMGELQDYLRLLYNIGADAILIQDLGVAALAREIVPDLPLHASTQMTVHNLAGVKYLEKLGFQRIVLSRELSLDDIRYICANSIAEIEVFIHGALCVCYSGQCLMSSLIGGRSGNRGRCAQPCRLPYSLVDSKGQKIPLDAGDFLLSPRDLNTLELLPELIAAGVVSYKIEGRMKRPEYVAIVTDTYRQAIDRCLAAPAAYRVADSDQKELAQIFNRDFTTAYLRRKLGRKMMSDRRPNNRGVRIGRVIHYDAKERTAEIKLDERLSINDVLDFWVKVGGRVNVTVKEIKVAGQSVHAAEPGMRAVIALPQAVHDNDRVFKVFDAALMERARKFFQKGDYVRKIGINVTATVCSGQPLQLEAKDTDGFTAEARTPFLAEKARNRPLTAETIKKQVARLGNTVFQLSELHCNIAGDVMVPVSEINEARRLLVNRLEEARLQIFARRENAYVKPVWPETRKPLVHKSLLGVSVDSLATLRAAIDGGADYVFFGGECFNHMQLTPAIYTEAIATVHEAGREIIMATPRIVREWQMSQLLQDLALFAELQADGVSIANIGTLVAAQQLAGMKLYGECYLNIYNAFAADFYRRAGLTCIALSPELNMRQLQPFAGLSGMETECLVQGRIEMMVSEYCLLGSYIGDLTNGCHKPCRQEQYFLQDRKEARFPVVTDQYCRMHILNSKELSMAPHVAALQKLGIDRMRIDGRYASPDRVLALTKLYRSLIDLGEQHPLVMADDFSTVEHDITRGHYFRGVL